jgi:GT2 family glycosyltransferase
MIQPRSITAVVLTYNSTDDLPECLDGLVRQEGCDLRICVVDNASTASSRVAMLDMFRARVAPIAVLNVAEAERGVADRAAKGLFVQNDINAGYSAGNNIGARLAVALGSDAVLILNPDVRIVDPRYVSKLAARLFSEPRYAVAASAMRNLAGDDENPMQELGFLEELAWPVWMVLSRFGVRPPSRRTRPSEADKVSGSCLLVRSDFLRELGFFDESVFLYCEEAILAVQIRRLGRKIVYAPELEAVHAHKVSTKGDPSRRTREWIRSRRYYHANYSEYGPLRRSMLAASHQVVLGLLKLQHHLGKQE